MSCNVLSQLLLGMVWYAKRIRGADSLGDESGFSRRILQRHIDWLGSLGSHVCLIADTHQHHRTGGRITCNRDILWGFTLPPGGRCWLWDLAPRPEVSEGYNVQHQMVGYVRFPMETWMSGAQSESGTQHTTPDPVVT